LLKVETKNKALNKIKWRPRVHKLLKVIDSSCLSAEDTRLSIMEMNSLDKEYMKYVNVKKLLKMIDESVEDDSSEENDSSEDSCKGVSLEMILPIIRGPYNFGLDVNFTSMGELVGSAVSDRLDNCNGYGSDFPFSRICEFILPDLDTSNDYDSSYLNLDIKACDQGWGGTGHVQVRYQINDGECLHGFNVNRDNNITGEYNISIPLDQTLHSSDKIILYLLCPTWGGWCANVSSVEGEICYE
jgi:hypothetical protein